MEVTILNRHAELHVNTITIAKTPDIAVHLFRCIYDAWAIAQFQGQVVRINPNVEPTDQALIISRCKGCGSLYSFLNVKKKELGPIRVVLNANPYVMAPTQFCCHICRQVLLQYNAEKIVDKNRLIEVKPPFYLKCPNPECGVQYNIVDVV